MAVPDYQSLMLPLLTQAAAEDKPVSIMEVAPVIARTLGLTETQLAERLSSGRQAVFHNRLHWAKQYMTRAGLLETTQRGLFQVTSAGRDLLAKRPVTMNNRTLAEYPGFNAWLRSRSPSDQSVDGVVTLPVPDPPDARAATPEERMLAARRELDTDLALDLLDRVRQMSPGGFETLILKLLREMDYGRGREQVVEHRGGPGDGGIDGVVHQDPLGLDRVYIQAKRYKEGNSVGPDAINSFIGALNIKRASKGLFVTASTFTKQAREHAERSTTHVVLIDGEALADLMVRHGVGVVVRHTIQIKEIDEGYFSE